PWRGRKVRDARMELGADRGKPRGEKLVRPERRGQPEHRRLLRHLAPAAVGRDARMAMEAPEQRARLRVDLRDEGGIARGVVEAREHEVLPDEDAELVAQLVELV